MCFFEHLRTGAMFIDEKTAPYVCTVYEATTEMAANENNAYFGFGHIRFAVLAEHEIVFP